MADNNFNIVNNRIASLLLFVAVAFAATTAFAQPSEKPAASAAASPAQKYTCSMHPDVVQDKPGKCPKCGMKLVPKNDAEAKQR